MGLGEIEKKEKCWRKVNQEKNRACGKITSGYLNQMITLIYLKDIAEIKVERDLVFRVIFDSKYFNEI